MPKRAINITINSVCVCKKNLISIDDELVTLLPCQHIVHLACLKLIPGNKCLFCHEQIKNIITYTQVKKLLRTQNNSEHWKQIYIDMKTLRNRANTVQLDAVNLIYRMPSIISFLYNLSQATSPHDIKCEIDNIINFCNIQIKIKNKNKISLQKKVIIANHVCVIDPLVICKLFNCGFLASTIIKETWIGQILSKHMPIILTKRGAKSNGKNNTVNEMKKFMKKNKFNTNSLCLFPEGIIHNQDTLIEFRSGAFRLGYPIQPIVIKYHPCIHDYETINLTTKLFSQDKIIITVQILDMEYPPFDRKKIEKIRQKMARVNNLKLSRISNRDIKDKK